MRIIDCGSDVCSSDLVGPGLFDKVAAVAQPLPEFLAKVGHHRREQAHQQFDPLAQNPAGAGVVRLETGQHVGQLVNARHGTVEARSEEHTSELQSLMRISYAVFCLKKNIQKKEEHIMHTHTDAQL